MAPTRKRPDRTRTQAGRTARRSAPFPVDVRDRGEEFLVVADLPGLRKQDIDVSVRKDKLAITADYDDERSGTTLRSERPSGVVRRVVRLPDRVDENHVGASYDDGVLRVTLRKRHRPRRIEIE